MEEDEEETDERAAGGLSLPAVPALMILFRTVVSAVRTVMVCLICLSATKIKQLQGSESHQGKHPRFMAEKDKKPWRPGKGEKYLQDVFKEAENKTDEVSTDRPDWWKELQAIGLENRARCFEERRL